MRVLVTGSNGFLGSSVVRSLLEQTDCEIHCMVRAGSSQARLDEVITAHANREVRIVSGSLKSAQMTSQLLDGVDTVYHVAAGMKGTAADLFLSSVVASKNLVEAIVAQHRVIRVVLVSSFGVYAAAKLPPGALLDESTPLEPHPEKRDLYSFAKLRQEKLFWDYRERHGLPLVVLRPGVIYGPSGPALSNRIGLAIGGIFLHLGGRNELPLTYVDNCADAIVCVGQSSAAEGQAYNVLDDDLPNCAAYLSRYRRDVKRMRVIPVPFSILMTLSRFVEQYSRRSNGQLPPVFTPYKTLSSWKGYRCSNNKLKGMGWQPRVSTEEGLKKTFDSLKRSVQGTE